MIKCGSETVPKWHVLHGWVTPTRPPPLVIATLLGTHKQCSPAYTGALVGTEVTAHMLADRITPSGNNVMYPACFGELQLVLVKSPNHFE